MASTAAINDMPPIFIIKPVVANWTVHTVFVWVCSLGEVYQQYALAFVHHGVDGAKLLSLTDEDYQALGVHPLHKPAMNIAIVELNLLTQWYNEEWDGGELTQSPQFDAELFSSRIANPANAGYELLLTLVMKTLCQQLTDAA